MSGEKVFDSDGIEGLVIGLTPNEDALIVRLNDDSEIEVPVHRLKQENEGLRLPARFRELPRTTLEEVSVPVIREEVKVDKRTVDKRKVRIRKAVHRREEEVRVPLLRETIDIQRVPTDLTLSEPAQTREENGVLIIPVQEEVLVVEKRYRVFEELHVITKKELYEQPTKVSLLSEEVMIEKEEI